MNKARTRVVFESFPLCELPAQYGQARRVVEKNKLTKKTKYRTT